jgi:hypothetical protein
MSETRKLAAILAADMAGERSGAVGGLAQGGDAGGAGGIELSGPHVRCEDGVDRRSVWRFARIGDRRPRSLLRFACTGLCDPPGSSLAPRSPAARQIGRLRESSELRASGTGYSDVMRLTNSTRD